jgi:tetratricopeptide (TPR) repeat protein
VVDKRPTKARTAYEEGLKAAPNHPSLLTRLAFLEFETGQFDSAEAHATRVVPLDPRSNFASVIRGLSLQVLRRYPEASAAYAHARAIAPSDLYALENSVLVQLDQGELDSARRLISQAKGDVDSTALYSFFANANDLGWVLDSAQQMVVLRQPWEAFGDHPAFRFIIHAQIYHWWGDTARTRTYADSARRAFDQILRDRPYLTKADHYALRGLALAYLGDKARAVEEGKRGLARALQVGFDWDTGYIRSTLARIYAAVGEHDRAIDEIDTLVNTPSYFGRGWFRIDPNFFALQAHPRFKTLVGSQK